MRTYPHLPLAVTAYAVLGLALAVGAQVTPLPPRQPGTPGVTRQPDLPRIGPVTPLDPPAKVNHVFALGTATVFGGNVSAARQAALQAAYAEAVARGAGVEIGRLTLVRNVRAVS